MEKNTAIIDREYDRFTNAVVPFRSLDIKRAINVALQVEEDGDWVADLVLQYVEETRTPMEDVDVVACVYETILQEARTEIGQRTKFDFCNDGAYIEVSGSYCATSYNWADDANIVIKDKLIENNIAYNSLSVKTQWFLSQIEAIY